MHAAGDKAASGLDAGRRPGPHVLILSGGGPLGVAFQAGALLCLEDALGVPLCDVFGGVIGASAGAVTGAYLCTGSGPRRVLQALSGRFPDQIEYFDPFFLLSFDAGRLPSLLQTLWRSGQFLLQDWLRSRARGPAAVAARKAAYDAYLTSIQSILDMVPPGWFQADGLREYLARTLCGSEVKSLSFDDLPHTLLVKATDLGAGVEAIFGPAAVLARAQGHPICRNCRLIAGVDVLDAVLYSSAIPFLFAPPRDRERYMADGEVRQVPTLKMAEHLLDAASIFVINPLAPLTGVRPESPTSELFLQTILTLLEGNVMANLVLSVDGLPCGRTLDRRVPYVYAAPSAEQMALLTERSVVNLFRYRPAMPAAGYLAQLRALEGVPGELREELAQRGVRWDLARPAEKREAMETLSASAEKVEDVLLS